MVRRPCEACKVLEGEIQNDHEGGRRPLGVKYATIHDPGGVMS